MQAAYLFAAATAPDLAPAFTSDVGAQLTQLPRIEQTSDFHCVTTWTRRGLRFMVHPRARVALEERGQWVPGWLLRHLYRPLIGMTVARFERGMRERRKALGRDQK